MRLRSFCRPLFLFSLLLTGCASLCGECGYLSYLEDYSLPTVLPLPESFPEKEKSWTRREAFGVNGDIKVTFEDPSFTAASLASYAAHSGLGEKETLSLLQNRWFELYSGGKKFSFQVHVELDSRFYTRKTLDLDSWKFFLSNERGDRIAVLDAGPCKTEEDDDFLKGDFRVTFPRFDIKGNKIFTNPRFLKLQAETPLTPLDFTWRFRPLAGPENGNR